MSNDPFGAKHTSVTVEVRNRSAGRPLLFHVPGRTVRLAPGEAVRLPRELLDTHELAYLRDRRLVVVED
jgi:hypothetical protein